MQTLLTLLILLGCFFLMAIGLIFAQKVLKRGCSGDPDACGCRKNPESAENCDLPNQPAKK